jgi:hemolysin-activating ACP:hemolysin acyltransferase
MFNSPSGEAIVYLVTLLLMPACFITPIMLKLLRYYSYKNSDPAAGQNTWVQSAFCPGGQKKYNKQNLVDKIFYI